MLKKYRLLNVEAKKYLIDEINSISTDKNILERCYKEIDILFNKRLLFIIKELYDYKKRNDYIMYYFKGTINNLLFLYVLKINNVNPIKYNLPYELFNATEIDVEVLNDNYLNIIDYLKNNKIVAVSGYYEKEEIEDVNILLDNHFLLIPIDTSYDKYSNMYFKLDNNFNIKTVDDYRKYKDKFLTIRISNRSFLHGYDNITLNNVLNNDFEYEVATLLNPKTIDDYIKIKSLSHGTNVWKDNQDKLVENKKIDINNLIASREDIYEYLSLHSIDKKTIIEIINYLCKKSINNDNSVWKNYVKIMRKFNCEEIFITILSKIEFISGKGQAVSECLFVLDKNNYEEDKI